MEGLPRWVTDAAVAAIGVFAGTLLAASYFGDGIQDEDIFQAMAVATIAAAIQWQFSLRRDR
jgi:uncharacterized membrane protein AbrB (regulator of aidB expression)